MPSTYNIYNTVSTSACSFKTLARVILRHSCPPRDANTVTRMCQYLEGPWWFWCPCLYLSVRNLSLNYPDSQKKCLKFSFGAMNGVPGCEKTFNGTDLFWVHRMAWMQPKVAWVLSEVAQRLCCLKYRNCRNWCQNWRNCIQSGGTAIMSSITATRINNVTATRRID